MHITRGEQKQSLAQDKDEGDTAYQLYAHFPSDTSYPDNRISENQIAKRKRAKLAPYDSALIQQKIE